ncbi:hypothetical protein [Nonomuraea basaltis]|uniref:hypothetical protein n=1 Tax=Nonomuraea basaltis TaxID=2495887 RepID=UPI00110C47B2|nr:hypothetical protein [Nonomuraea basaltis]TMR90097.1 hypothetical protein EJK15_57170 [Nonomuraea basaltis]
MQWDAGEGSEHRDNQLMVGEGGGVAISMGRIARVARDVLTWQAYVLYAAAFGGYVAISGRHGTFVPGLSGKDAGRLPI